VDLIVGWSGPPDSRETHGQSAVRGSTERHDCADLTDLTDLELMKAESLGWLQLDAGAYLHISDESAIEVVITGVPQAGSAVLLLV
jgi:hypothetical protein